MRPLLPIACLLGALPAQRDARVQQLLAADPLVAARAHRELLATPAKNLPVASLVDLIADSDASGVAARLLVRAGVGCEQLAAPRSLARIAAQLAAVTVAPSAALRPLLADGRVDSEVAAAALCALADRGEVAPAELSAALARGDDLAHAATVILAHEMPRWPAALTDPADRAAMRRLLPVLALVPRQALFGQVAAVATDAAETPTTRLWAIAAMDPAAIDGALAAFVLDIAMDPAAGGRDALHAAIARLPVARVDQLVAELQGRLGQGAAIGLLLPVFESLSAAGEAALFAAAETWPPATRDAVCQWLGSRGAAVLQQAVVAALDGERPLVSYLLARAGPLLDRPARIAAVAAVFRNGDQLHRSVAFELLCRARIFHPDMLTFEPARPPNGPLLSAVLEIASRDVPDEVYQQALAEGGPLRRCALLALAHRGFSQATAATLIALLPEDEKLRPLIAHALAAAGTEADVLSAWPDVRHDEALARDVVDTLAVGRRPWVAQLFLAELQDSGKRPVDERTPDAVLEAMRLALAESGDRRTADQLIAAAAHQSAAFVRRCRHALTKLSAPQAGKLLDAAAQDLDVSLRVELLLWATDSGAPAVVERLLGIWHGDAPLELREAAMRGLMASPQRANLVAELDRALAAGRWSEDCDMVAFETVATMPTNLQPADVDLLAALALQSPVGALDDELRRAMMFPDGRSGFPLAMAVVDHLHRAMPVAVGAAFAAVARRLAASPARVYLARQRLLSMWTAASGDAVLQQELAAATAPLLLAIPDDRGTGDGPAHLFLGRQAEAAGDFAAAADHFATAARALLRSADGRMASRIFVGERDVGRGHDPRAALAARPSLCRARAALAAGDRDAALAALADCLALAGADLATVTAANELRSKLQP